MKNKLVLDPCSGSRMFWFDKENPIAVFGDIREEEHTLCDGRELKIAPDVIMDFTNLPYEDNTFKLVVFDPPHLKNLGKESWMAKKYGVLGYDWENDLTRGFNECMRVLDLHGTLIFKWNDNQIKVSKLLELFGQQPLFGHKSGKQANTHWMCFMKLNKTN